MTIIKNPVLNIKEDSADLVIDLETAKNFLKVDFDNDDDLIKKLIRTATTQCETNINKTLTQKTYVYSIYNFPSSNPVVLPYPPIKSIDEVKVVNANGGCNTVDSGEYYLDDVGGLLNFKGNMGNAYRIDIEYTAGLESVNEELIQGLLMHIARMYEDRSGYSPIPLNSLNIYKKYKQIRI